MKPKCEVDEYGTKRWFLNGRLYREDGPAVEWTKGTEEWWLNGRIHREDGPAVKYPGGAKKWFLNGEQLDKEDFTSIEMVVQFKAFELFTPRELLILR